MSVVPIRGADLDAAEVAWFAPLCPPDAPPLGVPVRPLPNRRENTTPTPCTAAHPGGWKTPGPPPKP